MPVLAKLEYRMVVQIGLSLRSHFQGNAAHHEVPPSKHAGVDFQRR